MNTRNASLPIQRFRGPHIGFVALVFVGLFLASLFPVTAFGGMPYFPGPNATVDQMIDFFTKRSSAVLLCAFLQFGSAIPLGLFTASVVSQLNFLRVRTAGTNIALFGGFLTAANVMGTACFLWAMTYPEVSHSPSLVQAIYRISFGLGGPGYSVCFGILAAGVSVIAGFYRLLPRWLVVMGLAVAVIGELSWFSILSLKFLLLIPLTRFPGFIWMITVGFALPRQLRAGGEPAIRE